MMRIAFCDECGEQVSEFVIHDAIPPPFRDLSPALSLADVGAIDVIYKGSYPLDVEYPRERDIE
jgi:hypothetical protein